MADVDRVLWGPFMVGLMSIQSAGGELEPPVVERVSGSPDQLSDS
jgi:hypothetical protein